MPDQPPLRGPRVASLDVFRGLTMAAMVIVNNPGSWEHVYPPLRHAEWHGCTPTDLIFPFFLFAVGASMALSKGDRRDRSAWIRAFRRATVLFALGLMLNASSMLITRSVDLGTLRVMGVLQRIAICYALAFAITRLLRPAGQAMLAAAILIGYWAAMLWLPFPGRVSATALSPENNLCGWIDRAVIGAAHIYKHGPMDPEGLLSTLPATVSVLVGFWAGLLRRAALQRPESLGRIPLAGLALVLIGWLWQVAGFPVNKQLWTSSYVLYTGGWAAVVLWICAVLVDRPGGVARRIAWPIEVLGRNAILLFVGSGLSARVLAAIKLDSPGERPMSLASWIYQRGLVPWAGPLNGSLAYSFLTLLAWWVVLWVFWCRRWFWRV